VPTKLVSVTDGHGAELQQSATVTNWLNTHFTSLAIDVLKGDTKEAFKHCLDNAHPGSVIVMGAYGRSAVSRFFRQSFSNYIISQTNMPLFITHE
jgi:hypothetical protein